MSEARKATYDLEWQKKYARQIVTADQAVQHIKPGQRVFIGTG